MLKLKCSVGTWNSAERIALQVWEIKSTLLSRKLAANSVHFQNSHGSWRRRWSPRRFRMGSLRVYKQVWQTLPKSLHFSSGEFAVNKPLGPPFLRCLAFGRNSGSRLTREEVIFLGSHHPFPWCRLIHLLPQETNEEFYCEYPLKSWSSGSSEVEAGAGAAGWGRGPPRSGPWRGPWSALEPEPATELAAEPDMPRLLFSPCILSSWIWQ